MEVLSQSAIMHSSNKSMRLRSSYLGLPTKNQKQQFCFKKMKELLNTMQTKTQM